MSNQKLEEKKIGSAPKPSIGSELNEPKIERRSFISWITFAWITFAAALGGLLTMPLRLFFPNVLFEPPQSFKIGVPSDYEIDVVDLRWQDKFGTWIIRNTEGIYALSTVCTHLGCAQVGLKMKINSNVHVMEVVLGKQEYILKVLHQDLLKDTELFLEMMVKF